jgi:hypothetical protein
MGSVALVYAPLSISDMIEVRLACTTSAASAWAMRQPNEFDTA